MAASMVEIDQHGPTWPQLAGDVASWARPRWPRPSGVSGAAADCHRVGSGSTWTSIFDGLDATPIAVPIAGPLVEQARHSEGV